MQSRLNPYVSFKDNTREAMEFYKSIFGGNLEITTYSESGMDKYPDEGDKVMHAMLEAANGITFMAADTPNSMPCDYENKISMSLSGNNEPELTRYFNELSIGGEISEPLTMAPWGDAFGMLVDKYGVHWMVNISGEQT